MTYWSIDNRPETPYPWSGLFKGAIGISFVIGIFFFTNEKEDVITTAAKLFIYCTGVLLKYIFRTCELLAHHVFYYYWLPLLVLFITWYVFPEIVDDLLFLIYLGYKRYKTFFF